ncbi:MAG: GNAT family N-acetyltransferase [Burkholderiales bacterium]
MIRIRKSRKVDFSKLLAIINNAALAYQGVIPQDCWQDPYMPQDALRKEMADGVEFWVAEENRQLKGVMGMQDRGEVVLVRHAYVAPASQGKGVGTMLLRHLEALAAKPVLIGTWSDATWAIQFYLRNGYSIVPAQHRGALLQRYWSVSARQVETSVVLASASGMQFVGEAKN